MSVWWKLKLCPFPHSPVPSHAPSSSGAGVGVGVWGAQPAPCYLRARGVFIRFKQQLAPQGGSCSHLIRDALLSHMKLHAVIRQAACTAAKQREAGSWWNITAVPRSCNWRLAQKWPVLQTTEAATSTSPQKKIPLNIFAGGVIMLFFRRSHCGKLEWSGLAKFWHS